MKSACRSAPRTLRQLSSPCAKVKKTTKVASKSDNAAFRLIRGVGGTPTAWAWSAEASEMRKTLGDAARECGRALICARASGTRWLCPNELSEKDLTGASKQH